MKDYSSLKPPKIFTIRNLFRQGTYNKSIKLK